MKTKTPSWDDLRILLAVHRDKSFLAAGKALGVAPSTVARRIEALERTLGRPIVHRANDGMRLDTDALRLVALAEELELGLATSIGGSRAPSIRATWLGCMIGRIRGAFGAEAERVLMTIEPV